MTETRRSAARNREGKTDLARIVEGLNVSDSRMGNVRRATMLHRAKSCWSFVRTTRPASARSTLSGGRSPTRAVTGGDGSHQRQG